MLTLTNILIASFFGLLLLYFFLRFTKKQKMLKRQKDEFESILDNIPAMVLYKDLSGNILKANRTFINLFKHLTKNPVGKKSEEFVPGLKGIVPQIDEQVIRSGHPLDFYFSYEDPVLGTRWIGGVKVPYRNGYGKTIGTIMLGKDITEQKRAEENLKFAKENAELANLAKSDFLSRISHEIRAPLSGLIGMSELLMGTHLTPDQHRYAKTIYASAELLFALLSDVLDLSKIEQGLVKLNVAPTEIEVMVSEMAEILELEAIKNKVEIMVRCATDVPKVVFADLVRLKQVLLNLLLNAIKFSGGGEVLLSVEKKGDNLLFSVNDNGIGIPKDKQHLLFKKYSQLDPTIALRFGGTGLGLSISRELVHLMGGEIQVESDVGLGSTFYFEIPCHPAPSQPPLALLRDEIKTKRILVVDDYAQNRETFLIYLHYLHCDRSEAASSGQEAIDRIQQAEAEGDPYSFAFIDFAMPEMNGKQLGKLIRKNPKLENLKLVLFSGIAKLDQVEDVKDHGFSALLFKPIFIKDLIQVLNRL